MTYRVIQWTTGMVGVDAVAGIALHPDLELVGLWAHAPDKVGRDAGELAGIAPLGVPATDDADALLASDADCICYTSASLDRVDDVIAEIEAMLRAGKNVVNTSWAALVHPAAMGDGVHERLQAACLAGGSSFYTSGIEPGPCSFGMALCTLAMCRSVRTVRMYEIVNASSWLHPGHYTLSLFGFGQAEAPKAKMLTPGWTAAVWGPTVRLVADAVGLELDGIVERNRLLRADESFDIADTHIAAGTISGIRFEILGMVDGEPRVAVDHITKLRDQDFPEAPFKGYGGYRVEIDGDPCFDIDIQLSSHTGDHIQAAYVATAMPVVNAIPAVCDAAPGVLTYLDLLPHPTRHVT